MVVGGLLDDAELTARLLVIKTPSFAPFLKKKRYNSLSAMKNPSLCLEALAAW
jgi:hypothetical protein